MQLHQLGRDLKHANQAVKEGETLHVVVERVDRKARRISLSKLSSAELEEKFGSIDWLQGAGWTEVFAHIQKGTAHGIAPDGLSVALAFMRDRLGYS